MVESTMNAPYRGRVGAIGRFRTGRRRFVGFGVLVALVTVLVVWIWKTQNLDGLPDVGDPFDVAAARRSIDIADTDNAYTFYVEAKGELWKLPAALSKLDFAKLTWATANDDVHVFVGNNRPALELWREGSERPAAVYNQPGNLAMDTVLPVVQQVAFLSTLAGLQGSRLEQEGAMVAAWNWYRAMLRSSRHVGMHGVLVERMIGASQHEVAARHMEI
jgi:hypothetical protein